MRVSSSCMFHLGSRVSLYLSAKSGWCDHEVSGTRKSFLLTTFGQICSQELSRSVFGLQDFFIKLPLLSPRNRLFFWSKVGGLIQIFRYCKRLPSDWSRAGLHKDHLVVCLFVHAENGPLHWKTVVDCPLVIISTVKPFSTPDKTSKKEWVVQPVFCIVDTGSCFE